jgi:hypothetical protein
MVAAADYKTDYKTLGQHWTCTNEELHKFRLGRTAQTDVDGYGQAAGVSKTASHISMLDTNCDSTAMNVNALLGAQAPTFR